MSYWGRQTTLQVLQKELKMERLNYIQDLCYLIMLNPIVLTEDLVDRIRCSYAFIQMDLDRMDGCEQWINIPPLKAVKEVMNCIDLCSIKCIKEVESIFTENGARC